MSLREAIEIAARREEVPATTLEAAFGEIMDGKATPAQIAGLLVALRTKGETVDEIVATARAMRARAVTASAPDPRTLDCCGTGGSGRDAFSISTTVAFVVAGAGVPVAKHGNRAVTSKAASFDTLAELGVRIDLPIEACARILGEVGVACFFARTAHPAMRFAGPIRKELGVRTLLNCVGPLLNPVGARYQLVGVYADTLVEPLARALAGLGAARAMVAHGSDGMDELTTTGKSRVALVEPASLETFEVVPEDLGLARARPADLVGGDAATNAAILLKILEGEQGPRRDIVLLNAAAGLRVAGVCDDLREGVEVAAESIDSGAAREKLEALVRATSEASEASG